MGVQFKGALVRMNDVLSRTHRPRPACYTPATARAMDSPYRMAHLVALLRLVSHERD